MVGEGERGGGQRGRRERGRSLFDGKWLVSIVFVKTSLFWVPTLSGWTFLLGKMEYGKEVRWN
jgi:hypothetical protein